MNSDYVVVLTTLPADADGSPLRAGRGLPRTDVRLARRPRPATRGGPPGLGANGTRGRG